MRLDAFVDEIHRTRGVDRDSLRESFLAAARNAVREHLGDRPRIEAGWNAEAGFVELRQVLTAVAAVREPFRELPVASLRALGNGLESVREGEELELSLLYADGDRAQAEELDRQFGGLLALSCWQSRLWEPLVEAFVEVIHAHLPPVRWPEGTLGHLLQNDGGWAKGLSGDAGGVTVSIAGATWKERPASPESAAVLHGLRLRVERGGRGVAMPMERTGDRAALVAVAGRPAPPTRRDAVVRALSALASELLAERSIGSPRADDRLPPLLEALGGR